MGNQWEQFEEISKPSMPHDSRDNGGYLVPVRVPQVSGKYGKNLLQLLWGVLGVAFAIHWSVGLFLNLRLAAPILSFRYTWPGTGKRGLNNIWRIFDVVQSEIKI